MFISFTGKTVIVTPPMDMMVYYQTEAKFTCTATTDPEEATNLGINWMKDGQMIDYALAPRVYQNLIDNSLTISGTIYLDTGVYTCVGDNGLDTSNASAQLIVQGFSTLFIYFMYRRFFICLCFPDSCFMSTVWLDGTKFHRCLTGHDHWLSNLLWIEFCQFCDKLVFQCLYLRIHAQHWKELPVK